jgi:sugar phosphate isomerase/epimerase
MTILGLGTYGVGWGIGVPGHEQPAHPMTAFEFMQLAADLGLRLVQYADNLPLHALSDSEQAALRRQAESAGIRFEVGTRGIASEWLRSYIALARDFGSPLLRVVVDTKDHHPSPEEVVELVRAVLPELETARVTLAIENHDRFKARTFAEIIEAIHSPFAGICLDTVNSFGALEGPEVVVTTLAPYVVNLHVKEFIVRRASHSMGFSITGMPAGQGMLDMPWLLGQLNRFGRTYNAIVEQWPAPEATMEATIAKELDWMRQSVAYLRTVIPD